MTFRSAAVQSIRSESQRALAYYWDHRDEIEHLIERERRLFQDEVRTHKGLLQEKLKRT